MNQHDDNPNTRFLGGVLTYGFTITVLLLLYKCWPYLRLFWLSLFT